MAAAAATTPPYQTDQSPYSSMRGALIVSAIFHVTLFLLFTFFALPFLKKDMELAPMISVEILDIAEQTQAPKIQEKPPEIKPKEDKPPPKQEMEMPPTVTAAPVPVPEEPKPPEVSEELAEPREPEKMKEKPKPEKPLAPQKAPKPLKRPVVENQKPAENEEALQAVLRNLAKPQPKSDAPDEKKEETKPAETSAATSIAEKLTVSEQDALRQQLGQCWNFMIGARNPEELIIELKLFMNPDRTVREARIVDQMRYNLDSFYRAAADSATRAVFNPRCNPLKLPPDKYDQWKVITVRFDPRGML